MINNGNKYVSNTLFRWIIGGVFITIGIVGSFLWTNIDDIKQDIVPMKIDITEIKKDIGSILEKFETQEIGIVPSLPDSAVKQLFPVIPDPDFVSLVEPPVQPLAQLVEPEREPIQIESELSEETLKVLEELGLVTTTNAH